MKSEKFDKKSWNSYWCLLIFYVQITESNLLPEKVRKVFTFVKLDRSSSHYLVIRISLIIV